MKPESHIQSVGSENERIEQILSIFIETENFFDGGNTLLCAATLPQHANKIANAIRLGHRLQIVLPAFPAKSPNPEKCLGILPDQGEVLALKKLNGICKRIAEIHSPGAEMVICSDGRVFSDLVRVEEFAVNAYRRGIAEIIRDFELAHLKQFDLDDVFPNKRFSQMREKLVEEFGTEIEVIRERTKTEGEFLSLFNGIHRFLFEDQLVLDSQKSRSAVRKYSKELSYEVIRRSQAWSGLVEKMFPGSLRLSIHPQPIHSEKLPVRLVQTQNQWATPWHGVQMWNGESFVHTKRKTAEAMGASLVKELYPYFSLV